MKMIFKTTNRYGKYMVPRMIFMGTMGIVIVIGLFRQFIKYRYEEVFPYIMTGIAGFLVYYMIIKYIPKWFLDYFTVVLYEDKLIGYNLFGRNYELKFNSIKEIKKADSIVDFGREVMFLDEFNKKHKINSAIDYCGFIEDYIIEKCKDTAEIDYKWINTVKRNPYDWAYTRRMPFDTKYEDGYLEWLEPIVNAQKDMLIARGDLKPDVLYGDDVKKLLWVKKER